MSFLDRNMKIDTAKNENYEWYDPRKKPFKLTGFPWIGQENLYRRIPVGIEIPSAVDCLANCTAGGQIHFKTNAKRLAIKAHLSGKADMGHMPATGQCGFDCYIGEPSAQRFVSVSHYNHSFENYEVVLFNRTKNDVINITINFPLYQGVDKVWVGIDSMSTIFPPVFKHNKRVIFYGTSITQGGCASRPGMAYVNILSRRFNTEFINLGFSGNGKGEASMAKVISQIENPACLVLDYESNSPSVKDFKKTLPEFIRIYRRKHPIVPILLLSKLPYSKELYNQHYVEERLQKLQFQKELVKHLQQSGDHAVYFKNGSNLLSPHMTECTVDGTHPNDLGFMHIADNLTPIIEKLINP